MRLQKEEETVKKICEYLDELSSTGKNYMITLSTVRKKYMEIFRPIEYAVNCLRKTDYYDFNEYERKSLENIVLLVGCLYNMCKVKLVLKADEAEEMNKINHSEIVNEKKQVP